MTEELFEWLEFRFYHDNHVKYRKYFKEWTEEEKIQYNLD